MHLSSEAHARIEDARAQIFSLDDFMVRELALNHAFYKSLLIEARKDLSSLTQEGLDAIVYFESEAGRALENFMIRTDELLD